uniref:Albumin domain-containing protein n=1 Tax=Macaca fascicularis TaxID=9541 RepID=A0A2K5VX17_MACFA
MLKFSITGNLSSFYLVLQLALLVSFCFFVSFSSYPPFTSLVYIHCFPVSSLALLLSLFHFLNSFLYEVARRNPFVFAPTLLTVAAHFEEVAKSCCEEQNKVNCFQTRAIPVIQYLKAFSSYQKHVCGALLKFGTKVVHFIYIAVLSQKFPKIEFKELISLVEDISSNYEGCCEGDVVQCIRDTSKVMNHICSKQDSISSKIKECCEKKIPERGQCIINSNKDDRPKDLSLREAKFTDSENVCQERDADPDIFFAKFTFEYSRRHPDLSIPGLLRIVQIYKDLLRNCCNTENPPGCYRYAEDKFNETTEKSLKMVQQECKHFQNLGKDGLTYQYLIRLTKIAPQLSSEGAWPVYQTILACIKKKKKRIFALVDLP